MRRIIVIILCLLSMGLTAQTFSLQDILEDIYGQLAEEGMPMEDMAEQLMELASHPINLNQTNAEELGQLSWLSDEQIDDILMYQYQHPFVDVYELQLIASLKDYDIRNLLPFVYVGKVEDTKKIYFREVFRYAQHEITMRADARNIEDYEGDPMYGKLRYRFNYQNHVQMGLTIGRPTGAPWEKVEYGGYVQVQDIGMVKSIVAGNFQANFGQGLVVGTPFHMGKSSYITSGTNAKEGVRKFTAIGDDYPAFHGIGTTLRLGKMEVSGLYSLQQEDSIWKHVVGVNATGKWKKLKVGITAIENIQETIEEGETKEEGKAVVGLNARYNWGKVDVWGELAATQGKHWGIGSIVGMRLTPLGDVNLLALYRYYSPYFDNPYAYAFSEKSRLNDENGFYLGAEVRRLAKWRFAGYVDAFREGYDAMFQTDWQPNSLYHMDWRLRARQQTNKDTYALRYRFYYHLPCWTFRTQADANMVKTEGWNYGISVFQDIEYQSATIPIVVQMRIQAFDARQWNNRIYAYENDVLYAYSIPNVYGLGGRFWVNMRYKINDMFAIYLRLSETVYHKAWAAEHEKRNTRTDVHALVRIKL